MGCGAAKEAEEANPRERDAAQGRGARPGKNDDKAVAEVVDERPALTSAQIYEAFTAGAVKLNVPPLYLPPDAGPHVVAEKTPPQQRAIQRIVIGVDAMPPRMLSDDAAIAAADSSAPVAAAIARDGVLLRAFLPHSLSAYCVGWARPDVPASSLVSGFNYDADVDGIADQRAIAQSKPAERDVNVRRRLLLFPSFIDAVGLYLSVDGVPKSNRIVAPYSSTSCCGAPEVEPIDGAFATFSLMGYADRQPHMDADAAWTPRPAASTLPSKQSRNEIGRRLVVHKAAFHENSLSLALMSSLRTEGAEGSPKAVQRRLPDDGVTPAKAEPPRGSASPHEPDRAVEAAFAEAICGLDDGRHTVSFQLRFRYATERFTAVFDKPAAVAGTSGLRIIGTYTAASQGSSSSQDQMSECIASGECLVVLDAEGRARLADIARPRP